MYFTYFFVRFQKNLIFPNSRELPLFHGTASELASSVATESITERPFNSVNITSTIYFC